MHQLSFQLMTYAGELTTLVVGGRAPSDPWRSNAFSPRHRRRVSAWLGGL